MLRVMNASDAARAQGEDPALEELRRAYSSGELVVFVGAGVSAGAGLPSWRRLVEVLVERARSRNVSPESLAEISALVSRGQLIDALSAVKDAVGAAEFGAVVERELDDRGRPVPEVAKVLAELAPRLRALLTTNLDHLLERALGGEWPALARATTDVAQRRAFILKLHGTLLDRATWVFTREDYDRAMYSDVRLKGVFTALFYACPLLFVGYGLSDDDFDGILGQMRAFSEGLPPRHFALVPKESVAPNRRKRLEAAGVRLIPYDNPDGRHAEVARLLRSLALPDSTAAAPSAQPPPVVSPVSVSTPAPPPAAGCPFPGLEVFEEEQAAWFFGRDAEVVELTQRLGDSPGRHRRWVQLEGASGSGKSSLARAGLVPKVRKGWIAGAPKAWEVAVLRPGTEPLLNLAQALHAGLKDSAPEGWTLDRLLRSLGESETALASLLRERIPRGHGFLLVVDQLEEAFLLSGAEKGRRFDVLLANALRDKGGPLYLVTTVRSDFLARFRELPELELLLNAEASRYYVKPISVPGLRAAIEGPAELARLRFTPGLPERILADASSSEGALPLVAHVLRALWARRQGEVLTGEAYDALGGVSGSLAKSADEILDSLGPEGRARARGLLLRLVAIGRRETTRRTIPHAEALEAAGGGAQAEAVLARLSGARNPDRPSDAEAPPRLVVVTRTEAEDRVDLVHEALLRTWTTLRAWIDEDRKALERRDDLEAAAKVWRAAGSPEDGLPRGAQLAYLRAAEGASGESRAFLDAAVARDERLQREELARQAAAEVARARLRLERLRLGIAIALGVAVVSGAFAAYALRQRYAAEQARDTAERERQVAERARKTALAGELATRSETERERDPPLALRLALDAEALDPAGRGREALRGWWEARGRLVLRPAHPPSVALYSPDGTMIATAGQGSVQLWDARTGALTRALPELPGMVGDLTFSPDGTRLATGGEEGCVRIFEAGSGQLRARLCSHGSNIVALAFSPDGRRLASAGGENAVHLWDVETKAALGAPMRHGGFIISVAFSSDGQRLLTVSGDGAARLWSGTTGKLLFALRPAAGAVRAAAFSPDGKRVVTAGEHRIVLLWDAETGRPLPAPPNAPEAANAVRFSPDGRAFLVLSDTTLLYAAPRYSGEPLRDTAGQITKAAFSPDGQRLLLADEDGGVGVYDTSTRRLLVSLRGHLSAVESLTFSPDGQRALTASKDGTVRVWDVGDLGRVELRGHTQNIQRIAFCPDGRRVATASDDGTARIWDDAGHLLVELRGTSRRVLNVAFSPDGRRVLTTGHDGKVGVWDASTGEKLAELQTSQAVFTPDGQHLLALDEKAGVLFWDATGKTLQARQDAPGEWRWNALSADGLRVLRAAPDGTARIFDTTSGQLVATLAGKLPSASTTDFARGGARLAVLAPEGLWLCDATSGRMAQLLGPGEASTYALSPDGELLAAGDLTGRVRLWNARTGESRAELPGHSAVILAMAFSADGTRLATASDDTTVRVWEMPSGRLLDTLRGHDGSVVDVAFSPRGDRIATSGGQSALDDLFVGRILPCPLCASGDELRERARPFARQLTCAERQELEHQTTCP